MICHCPSYHALVNALIWLSQIKGFLVFFGVFFFFFFLFQHKKRIFPKKESLNDLNLFMTTETFNIRIKNSFKQIPIEGFIGFWNVVCLEVGFFFFFFLEVTFCLSFSKGLSIYLKRLCRKGNCLILAFFLHGQKRIITHLLNPVSYKTIVY
jgi:hypothetical protein